MKNSDVEKHVIGESLFIDDLPVPEGTLTASVLTSSKAHAKILSIDTTAAESIKGIRKIITAKDIPGINQIGGIIPDETLLAEKEVEFIGEPIVLVIAENKESAAEASNSIRIEYQELSIVTDPREAYRQNMLIMPPRTFEMGDVSKTWTECDLVIEGKVESGGQEHLYLETQGAIAVPMEGNCLKIYSSTQSPTAVQRAAARILNCSMNNIEVDVLRLGGAFGGKEDQATHWAVLSALGAYITKEPVKLVLSRMEDIYMTGKRHPYSSDFKIGLSKNYKILAYEVNFYQNSGAVADLSPAVLERTLFHATNAYHIPNVKATAASCKTNLPPNTAFRGFGGPQGKFVIEAAIHKVAEAFGINSNVIQKANLIKESNSFYYGQSATDSKAVESWDAAEKYYEFTKLEEEVNHYNKNNRLTKKGLASMPICFGISFTNATLNQASALVHVYTDGSIGVSTAAVEMGQGVNEKIKIVVADTFSVNQDRIKIESANTSRIANTSATAASSGADLNGNAAIKASKNILARLLDFASEQFGFEEKKKITLKNEYIYYEDTKTEISWDNLISRAYLERINLSSHEFYSTPEIYFDRNTNKGKPFAYHVYGTSITQITLDCIRGMYEIDYVKVVHDFGNSLDTRIDMGQLEGGIVQGIGWLTMEEVKYSKKGVLMSNSLSAYKIPDIYSIPKEIEVRFLESSENRFGPLKSKAIGEPPLMYGIGTYFAIAHAMRAFRPNKKFEISAPLTPEKILMSLYS